ncbi:PREDICTED: uncharacterized protein LOC105565865 [Vollenhovia emeryi]|uniref:uncharacterized protein LOC105565865 n=1 Tax=Vollenhovia emeryi TaxID=411798 RepID=UPI0005F3FAA7|nr:PREDICTED: uncharacterized protein LOC105565865 [Vollenhovia emeryi]
MANTSNVVVSFAIVFLVSLSSSSAFTKNTLDTFNAFEKNIDGLPHQLIQPLIREKRQEEAQGFLNDSPLELEEELSNPRPAYERRAVNAEEAKEIGQKDERQKQKKPEPSNDIEEDAEDDVFSYRNMHDLIQALILADEEDIAERLQQLRKNTPKSEALSNLPKRQASAAAAAAAAASGGLVGGNLWDVITLGDLDGHSCEVEAFSHGHFHVSGTIVHEFFCELRKIWHYGLLVVRNFVSALTLGPLVVGEAIGEGILDRLFHHGSHIFHAIISEPHHLLLLPDIIHDCVPFPSIIGAIHRVKAVFFRVLQFGFNLIHGHIRHVVAHIFSNFRFFLREIVHHWLHFDTILPLEEIGTVASAATATATATASAAAATATAVIPDYHTSLGEILSSCRGFHDGYYASGISNLLRTGLRSFSLSSTFSRIRSYLPSFTMPFFNYFGCGPVEQSTTVTTSSVASASSSVGLGGSVISPIVNQFLSPIVSPVIEPTIVPAETEVASSAATATATATVAETHPVLSVGPTILPTIVPSIVPYESTSSNVATATATAAAAVASPVVSDYQTIAAPEIAAPVVLGDTGVTGVSAAASAAAAASSSVAPAVGQVPFILRERRPRPILSGVAPAAATAAAAASASASTGGDTLARYPSRYRGLDLDLDRRINPLIRARVIPGASSAAASAAASASSSSAAASSAASSVSTGSYSFALPREHIVNALGHDYLLPGDVIAVSLRNRSTLFGRVLDATSPITFSFLRPKLRASLLHHGGRFWNLRPRDFRDPDCVRKFNNPLLLGYNL